MPESLVAEAGRLDAFLAKALPGFSRQFWKQRIADGSITVDGAKAGSSDFKLRGGESVVYEPSATVHRSPSTDLESSILHEDKHILVMNKPSGLIAHPLGESWIKTPSALDAEPDSVVGWLWRARPANRGLGRLGLVHRLDQGTSGVLVVAKTAKAYESLLLQFKERGVEKRYRAIVAGKLEDKMVKVTASVGRKYRERKITADPAGREALTEVHLLEAAKTASLVEARPKTGRTHQIRIHLQTIGHPVLGDREWPSDLEVPRLMLHAFRLTIDHPGTGKRVSYEAGLPKDFSECWKRLKAAKGTRAKGPKRR